jgi:hypothetical protein
VSHAADEPLQNWPKSSSGDEIRFFAVVAVSVVAALVVMNFFGKKLRKLK